MSNITIYHNPHCSKSRQTLSLLNERGINPSVVLYLQTPLSADELGELINKLAISPRELLRTSEKAYQQLGLSNLELSDDQLINAMVIHPKLMERPIVVTATSAKIGRPPENVLSLFE